MGFGNKRIGLEIQDESETTLYLNVDGTTFVTAGTYQLGLNQQDVIIDADAAYTYTIKLPPVGAAKGRFYSFYTPDAGGGVTITAYGDASSLDDAQDWTDLAMDADNDSCMLYSNGTKWIVLALDEN